MSKGSMNSYTAETVVENPKSMIVDFISAQKEMKSALKDSPNPYFKSKYADLYSIDHACREALHNHNFAISQPLDFDGEINFVRTELIHISGEKMISRCRILNPKGDSQGFGSSVTYVRRYSLASICGIVTEDDDGNKASGKEVENNYGQAPVDKSIPPAKSATQTPSKAMSISAGQVKRAYAIALSRRWSSVEISSHIKKWGYTKIEEMNWKDYKEAFPDTPTPKASTWDRDETEKAGIHSSDEDIPF